MASVVARLLETVGVDHLIGIDLHSPQIEGYFACPVDALSATPVLCSLLAGRLDPMTVVVSPDLGRVAMAGEVADTLGLDSAVLQKRREDGLATRVVGVMGDVRDRPCVIVDDILASPYTRVPVWEGEPENIVGVVHTKDLVRAIKAAGDDMSRVNIRSIAKKPWFIPDTTEVSDQLNAFLKRKSHFALVVDEYGEVQGLVTLEDIIEEIVGEISDEHDIVVQGVRPQPDGSVNVDGAVPIVFITGWGMREEDGARLAGLNVRRCLFKPVRPDELDAAIQDALPPA